MNKAMRTTPIDNEVSAKAGITEPTTFEHRVRSNVPRCHPRFASVGYTLVHSPAPLQKRACKAAAHFKVPGARSEPSRCRSPLNRRRPRHPKNHNRGSDTRSNEMFLMRQPDPTFARSNLADVMLFRRPELRTLQNIRGIADSGVAGRVDLPSHYFVGPPLKFGCTAKVRHTHRSASTL